MNMKYSASNSGGTGKNEPSPSKSGKSGKDAKKLVGRFVLSRGVIVAIAVIVVLGLALGVWAWFSSNSRGLSGLGVDGSAVSSDEFHFAVDAVKNDVVIEKAPEGSSIGGDFWKDSSGESPSYAAAERAVDQVTYRYAFYQVVAEAGLVDSPSWDALVQRFEAENASRDSNQSAGETVYGLSEFDLPSFVTYEEGVLEEQYVTSADNPGMNVTEEQIQEHFNSKEWTLDDQPATLDQVRANVVDDLRRSLFEQMVLAKQQELKVDVDVPALAKEVSEYLQ